jgi:hypothetical protein
MVGTPHIDPNHSFLSNGDKMSPTKEEPERTGVHRSGHIHLKQDRRILQTGRNYITLRNLLWHRVGTLWHHFVCVQQFH